MAKSSLKSVIIYVTRDIERALGMEPNETYQIVANKTAYAVSIQQKYPDFVHLVDSNEKDEGLLDTWEILENTAVKTLIDELKKKNEIEILVFKNISKIEEICKKNGWTLLNPSSVLAEKIENKMTQVEYLGALGEKYLPPHALKLTRDITWDKKPIVVQWAHSHTGLGTTVINSNDELKSIKEKFPERMARVSAFVNGPSFTMNVVVGAPKISLGNISYQITGIPPFTENPFTTIGNDWSLTHSLLNETEIAFIETMAGEIATKLLADGWKGLFGIDVMRDDELDKIYLIEINARQPASTTYESQLQAKNRELGVDGQTIFEAHLGMGTGPIIPINDGSQIIQRVTRLTQSISAKQIESFKSAGYNTILYSNTEENEDLLRIQSEMGIMETHGRFNKRGKEVIEILK
jgi:predicted ATP-grasp superfamily ATP-dependent carboligase